MRPFIIHHHHSFSFIFHYSPFHSHFYIVILDVSFLDVDHWLDSLLILLDFFRQLELLVLHFLHSFCSHQTGICWRSTGVVETCSRAAFSSMNECECKYLINVKKPTLYNSFKEFEGYLSLT